MKQFSLNRSCAIGCLIVVSIPNRAQPAQIAEISQQAAPVVIQEQPLYLGPIPNAKPAENEETATVTSYGTVYAQVSIPTFWALLPGPSESCGAAVIVFPGGGYEGLSSGMEGAIPAEALVEHGIAAIVVKYRMPSTRTMVDPSIGPLQDAQRAVQLVRQHAKEWRIDPHRVGVMGFSAGGHLAASVATQFHHPVIDNPDGISFRPDFALLVYPVVTMEPPYAHLGSRAALLGNGPTPSLMQRFSVEKQVTSDMPPALILAASDDSVVPIENSLLLYGAMRQHSVSASLHIFAHGEHGFFLLRRDEWQNDIWQWLADSGLTRTVRGNP